MPDQQTDMGFGFSRQDQINCAMREVEKRKAVYPRLIAAGKMTNEKAQAEIECMQSIVETLKGFR